MYNSSYDIYVTEKEAAVRTHILPKKHSPPPLPLVSTCPIPNFDASFICFTRLRHFRCLPFFALLLRPRSGRFKAKLRRRGHRHPVIALWLRLSHPPVPPRERLPLNQFPGAVAKPEPFHLSIHPDASGLVHTELPAVTVTTTLMQIPSFLAALTGRATTTALEIR